jgi:hypothetical protein
VKCSHGWDEGLLSLFLRDKISNLGQNGHGCLCFAMKISLKTLAAM